jgi:hypothetical protein
MEPGKPGVVQHQLQELAGGSDPAVNSFVRQLFRDDERFMEAEQAAPDIEEDLPDHLSGLHRAVVR